MQDAWHILRWTWAAVVVVYCVLGIVADRRLHGREKRLSRNMLIAMAVLVAIRYWVHVAFGIGQAYRFAVLVVGVAAGIGSLVLAKMLIEQKGGGMSGARDREDRMQSLKLN